MPLLLVRHASAGNRSEWVGDDRARPLDKRGRRQAAGLVDLLAGRPVERILSSPARRCLETVEPLAAARSLPVETRDELAEERQSTEGAELVRSLAGTDAVVCGHGGLERAALPDPPRWRKGAVFVVGPGLEVLESPPPPA
jgi:phosphohistidine phosphatase SixA